MSQLYRLAFNCKCIDIHLQRTAYKASLLTQASSKRTVSTYRRNVLPSLWQWQLNGCSRAAAGGAAPSRVTISTSSTLQTQNSGKAVAGGQEGKTADNSAKNAEGPAVVYVGTLARMVRFVKLFSLSSSIVGVAIQPYIYKNVSQLPVALAAFVGGFMGFFIFVTPLILHFVTKRYVTSITLDRATGRFAATTYTFFLNEKRLEFSAQDVKVPTVPRLFTTVVVNGKVPLFVDPSLFVDRDAFLQMMRYDEPLEWEIDGGTEDEKKPTADERRDKTS